MPPSDWSHCRRREFLRAGTAGAAGVATATAGCLEGLPPLGQRVRYGRIDAPDPLDADPTYRRWIPAPAAVPDGIDDFNFRMYMLPGNLGADTLGVSFEFGNSIAQAQTDYFGMDYDAYDRVIWLNGIFVIETTTDHSVPETLLDTGYREAGSYSGYDLFDRSDNPRTVAVGDDAILFSRGSDARLRVETIADAGDGNVDRRHEVDDQFAAFTDYVGYYPFGWYGFGLLTREIEPDFDSMSFTFDESAAYYIHHHRYDSGIPSQREIREDIESQTVARMGTGVDIERDDPFVTIEIRLSAETFREESSDNTVPLVTFGVDHDRTAETLRIRNDGGGTLETENLNFAIEQQLQSSVDWPGPTFAPGDSIHIDLSGFDDVSDIRLVYQYPDSEHSTVTIFSYSLDEGE